MTTTRYLWNPINQNIIREYDGAGNTVASYTTEPELYGDVVSQHRNGQDSVHHYDGQGSTLALTRDNGDITDTYSYTAFGEVTDHTGGAINPFQYIGQKEYYRDSETGEYDVRRRPLLTIGRWLSADELPWSNERTLYVYSHNSPFCFWDPSGYRPVCCDFQSGWLVADHFAEEIDCAAGKAADDCCNVYGSRWYRLLRSNGAFDGRCWRETSLLREKALGTAAVAGLIAIPSDPSDVVGTPAGGVVAIGALVLAACASSVVLIFPPGPILNSISQQVADWKRAIEEAARAGKDTARKASLKSLCLFYYSWCLWGNLRPPGDRGLGWRRNAPCESCFASCVESGSWPMLTCPIDGPNGPRWEDQVPPTMGQY